MTDRDINEFGLTMFVIGLGVGFLIGALVVVFA